jgi:hypothetical protein
VTIDIAKRFPCSSLKDAYARAKASERWVFPDTVCSSITMLYGRSNVGKSYLVASMLLSLLVRDRDFLGMQPTDPTKLWRPAILWTDPGSDEEYAERIYDELPPGEDVEVPMFHIGRTIREDEWEVLTDHLIAQGHNFVVLDNLMGATGDTNEPGAVTAVFDGLTRLTNHKIPVVLLHHESEKGVVTPGASPMGASVSVQKSRAWIQVRQTAKRKLRGGNTALIIQSNGLPQPQQIVAEPMPGPNFRVLNRGPWAAARDEVDEKPREKREKKTLDQNAEMARYVVDNCQGKGLNETAKELAEKFDKSQATCKDSLMRGALAKMLDRQGDGSSARWSWK